ncbi:MULTISPECIES: PEP-CTERM sorting domain-containing protein [Corallincola]|uniref:PEP-CTERM sorting domain-containing protein n=3 Tax=Corallincola TaxID=1775176 RepID=A0A368NHI1_9GAMM|nr:MULTISPECIES: PEP-CTERM sorting domain-containing protein [Corallincola]RCU49580.1 PEP-CTERM sorting domain-containing protein [Corallincola holothuriorum]TAA47876.1 PEP-CTERM sorting domain-containing protein [Corallincola spongiicola]
MNKAVFILSLLLAGTANAGVITFDEFAADNANGPLASARYDYLGVTFVATDDGSTWGGLANGDPGNWDLEGTNGSIFSGFNGASDGLTMLFSSDVTGFSLDASRSSGSNDGDTFTVEGWLDGALVQTLDITFGAVNSWSTLALSTAVDEVRWMGFGSGFNPYGVDNIQWNSATVPAPASIALLGLAVAGFAFARKRHSA